MSHHVDAESSALSLCRGSVAEVCEPTQGESREHRNNPCSFADAYVTDLFLSLPDTSGIKMRTCVLPRFLRKCVGLENRVQDIIKGLGEDVLEFI